MDSSTLALSIPILAILWGIVAEYFKHKEKLAQAAADRGDQGQTAAQDQRIAALEQRVRVLERLATDPEERLKKEFDRLNA